MPDAAPAGDVPAGFGASGGWGRGVGGCCVRAASAGTVPEVVAVLRHAILYSLVGSYIFALLRWDVQTRDMAIRFVTMGMGKEHHR